jgi:protein-S-isoprenylcysteine O-methyltransferase Ste14
MKTTGNLKQEPAKKISIPRWMALVVALIFWLVGVPLFYGVLPWAISLLTPHYGWSEGRPANWNLLGLIPVVIGTTCLIWIMLLHFTRTSSVPERVELEPTPSYLLSRGPYAFSRHPMYLSELALLLGWSIYYGSISVLIALVAAGVFFNFVHVPREERTLEARFGEAYLEYKNEVPRWL